MMRYKTLVSNKMDSVQMKLRFLQRGLEEKRFTPAEILQITKDTEALANEVIELVDAEKEELFK